MERLTMVPPAPGEPPAPGWTHESWREYATASVEHIDLRPQPEAAQELAFPSDLEIIGQAEVRR